MTHTYDALWGKTADTVSGVVAELLSRFSGGTPFFDALDEHLRDEYYFSALITKAIEEYPEVERIVVSGRFGKVFAPWLLHSQWSHYFPPALIVDGDLRHKQLAPIMADLSRGGYRHIDDSSPRYVFIDDSCYRFRTYEQVKRRIGDAGGKVIGMAVLYDGSRDEQWVPSFYRYHPEEGEKS